MQLTNFDSSELSWTGSGTISRLTICAFLGIQNLCDRSGRKMPNRSIRNLEKPEQEFRLPHSPGLPRTLGDTYALGRLAPYLERPCFRLATPAASSVPRIMW